MLRNVALAASVSLMSMACSANDAAGGEAATVAGQAAGQSGTYPAEAVYTALNDSCSDLSQDTAFFATIMENGWTPVADVSATPLAELAAFGAKFIESMGKGRFDRDARYYTRQVAGQDLYLEASLIDYPQIGDRSARQTLGCRIFDLGESRDIPMEAVESWFNSEPSTLYDSEFISGGKWTTVDTEQEKLNVAILRQSTSDDPSKAAPMVAGMIFAKEQENVED